MARITGIFVAVALACVHTASAETAEPSRAPPPQNVEAKPTTESPAAVQPQPNGACTRDGETYNEYAVQCGKMSNIYGCTCQKERTWQCFTQRRARGMAVCAHDCQTRDVSANWTPDKKKHCCQTHGKECGTTMPSSADETALRCSNQAVDVKKVTQVCGKEFERSQCSCAKGSPSTPSTNKWMCTASQPAQGCDKEYCLKNPKDAGCPVVAKPTTESPVVETNKCSKLTCGAACQSKCPKGQMCPAVMSYCQADGTCGMNAAPECPEKPACCKALTAQCLACSASMTQEEYCTKKPSTIGCKKSPVVETNKCSKLTCGAACQSKCPEGQMCPAVMSYCQADGTCGMNAAPECPEKPPACCEGLTAQCLACSASMTQEEYCTKKPSTFGCKKAQDAKAGCCEYFDGCNTHTRKSAADKQWMVTEMFCAAIVSGKEKCNKKCPAPPIKAPSPGARCTVGEPNYVEMMDYGCGQTGPGLNCECGADATWMCMTPMILPCIETTVAKTTTPPTDSTYPFDPICGGALGDMCALKGKVCVDGGTANARCVEKVATKGTTKGPTRPPTVASLSQVDRCAAHSGKGKYKDCKKLFPACSWTQKDKSCVVSTATATSVDTHKACSGNSGKGKYKKCTAAGCAFDLATKQCSANNAAPATVTGTMLCSGNSGKGKYKKCTAAGCAFDIATKQCSAKDAAPATATGKCAAHNGAGKYKACTNAGCFYETTDKTCGCNDQPSKAGWCKSKLSAADAKTRLCAKSYVKKRCPATCAVCSMD